MFHRVSLIGNLGGDPQLRYTPKGTPVASFNVATNRRWTDDNGEEHVVTTWFRVNAWGKLAEVCNEYLKKGRQVYVEGELIPDPETGGPRLWEGNDGKMHASFELRAFTVKFLGTRGNGSAEAPAEEPAAGEEEVF